MYFIEIYYLFYRGLYETKGDLIIKSGNIIINEFVDFYDHFFAVFCTTLFDKTGGKIK